MNRITLLFAILFALGTGEASACSCMSKGSFVDYARQSQGVIRARVVSYGHKLSHGETLYESMTVEVVAVLDGNYRFKSVRLLGDPGHLCRDYVNSETFVIGSEFLIALHGDELVQPFGGCGEAWLKLDGNVARGVDWTSGEPRTYSIPLGDLPEILKTP